MKGKVMKLKITLTVIVLLVVVFLNVVTDRLLFPVVSTDVGVAQLEDSDEAYQELRGFEWFKNTFPAVTYGVSFLIVIFIWNKNIKKLIFNLKERK